MPGCVLSCSSCTSFIGRCVGGGGSGESPLTPPLPPPKPHPLKPNQAKQRAAVFKVDPSYAVHDWCSANYLPRASFSLAIFIVAALQTICQKVCLVLLSGADSEASTIRSDECEGLGQAEPSQAKPSHF